MQEFIEELKHNQNINNSKNTENRIDIDYVIKRLEYIKDVFLNNLDYFKYHNKNLTKTQQDILYFIDDYLTDKGVFK
jgi:hypothetical protein